MYLGCLKELFQPLKKRHMNSQLQIEKVWAKQSKTKILRLEEIVGSGSPREYYRVFLSNNTSIIACYSLDIAENKTFIRYAKALYKAGVSVPKIIYHHTTKPEIYFQEDCGNKSLLEHLKTLTTPKQIIAIYTKAIQHLVHVQFEGALQIDFSSSHSFEKWDAKVVLQDLFYFKNFFLDQLRVPYRAPSLIKEFLSIADFFNNEKIEKTWYHFMYRDCQARNIMLNKEEKMTFIDFQGAMRGPIQYDIISLLFQAKANLSNTIQQKLLDEYKTRVQTKMKGKYSSSEYDTVFMYCFLLRHLQLLGAYGLRGLIEKKQHFRESIFPLLQKLPTHQNNYLQGIKKHTEISKVINYITTKNFVKQFHFLK